VTIPHDPTFDQRNMAVMCCVMGIYGGLMGIYGGLMGANGNLWKFMVV
jgi:hypothetical protein